MRGFAIACGFLMAAVGIVGIVDPLLLLDATSFTLTSLGLYIAAAFRVVFGLVLIGVASASRMPRTLRTLGAIIVVAGIITPFVGVERARGIVAWWVGQGNAFMRIWALIAVIFGLFVIYAVIPRRRSASL
jgi:uncharacterized membrane protein YbaN (DUF454 family)